MPTIRKTGKRVTWDKFRDKFKSYILNNFRRVEDVMGIATYLEDPTTAFKVRHMPAYLTEDKDKITSK